MTTVFKMSSLYSEIIYTTVTPIIGVIVVILNITELFFIVKLERRKRTARFTKSFIYITNLCISDVIVGIVMIVLKSMDPYMKTDLKNSEEAKELYNILKHVFIRVSMFVSIFNLLALTFDRYLAITFPLMHRRLGRSFTYKIILGVWFSSVVCVTLVYCIARFKLSDVDRYNNLVFPISSYATTVVFIFSYSLIFKTVRDSRGITSKAVNNLNMKKEVRPSSHITSFERR